MKSKMARNLCALASIVTAVAFAPSAIAGIMFTDLGSNNYGVTLDPITFTVSSNQSRANRLVIEDFFTTDATSSGVHISGNINWSLNGAPPVAFSFETFSGNFNQITGQIDPNDLFFNYTIQYQLQPPPTILAGDRITLSTNNMIFNALGNQNTPLPGPFTAHLLNGVTSISTTSVSIGEPIPEPSTLLLLASGLAGLGLLRRRRAN